MPDMTFKFTKYNNYNYMKKLLIPTMILGAVVSASSVFAEPYDDVRLPAAPGVESVSAVSEKPEKLFTNSLARIKMRGQQLIKERINSLNTNKTVIESSKTLTTEQKATLTALIASNVTGLSTLSAQIASSTDATSTKALVSSVFTNFRIYGVVIPQVRLEKRIFDLQNHTTKLSDTFLKVQAKIDEYKGKGKDTTVWQKSLDDAKVMVALDMNTLAGLSTKVMALKPADYGTSSKMIIDSVNVDIKSVAKDFNTISKNLHRPKVLKDRNSTTTPTVHGEASSTQR